MIAIFLAGFACAMFVSRYLRLSGEADNHSIPVDALYYLALPKPLLVRQLLLRDVQLKVLLRKSSQVKTTELDRMKILSLIHGFPAWKDHIFIVAASTLRNWMKEFPKGIWSLRTWIGVLKSGLLKRLGIVKKRAAHRREEILEAMRIMLSVDRIRGIDRIHGELKLLGFCVSRPSIARYLRRYFPDYRRPPRNGVTPKQLLTSIKNAWAVDFFVLLTFFGKPLYVFFIIHQENREIIHIGVTFRPTGVWVIDQTKRALAKHPAPKYLISDNDPAFKFSLASFLRSSGIRHLRITYRSPWQNGIAERWIQSARAEVFDRVPIFSSRQVERLLADYVIFYNFHRSHLSLNGDTPCGRTVTPIPTPDARLVSDSFADGLAHTFRWAA